jgi:hypothetical protein
MARHDVQIFNAHADEPGGTDVIIQLQGAQSNALASAVSAAQGSNNVTVNLTGASASADPGIVGSFGQAPSELPFPRLASVRVGSRIYAEDNSVGAEQRRILAMHDVLALGMYPNGPWDRGDSGWLTRAQVIQDLKTRNPNIVIVDYTDVMEGGKTGSHSGKIESETGPPGAEIFWGFGNNDWWARDGNGDGVISFGNAWNINITDYVTPDSQGRFYPQYYGDYVRDEIFEEAVSGGVSIDIDGVGVFSDVSDNRPKKNANDWNGDGDNDRARSNYKVEGSQGKISAEKWRAGHRDYILRLKSYYPNIVAIGNNTTHSQEYQTGSPPPYYPEYIGLWDGGMNEGQSIEEGSEGSPSFPLSGVVAEGYPNPFSPFGNFRIADNAYRYLMDNHNTHLPNSPYVMNHWAVWIDDDRKIGPQGSEYWTNNPGVDPDAPDAAWNLARWAMAATLLHNGYVNIGRTGYAANPRFDEMGIVNEGVTGLYKGWLGMPLTEPEAAPAQGWTGTWPHRIFFRAFENGCVILNESFTQSFAVTMTSGIPVPGELFAGQYRRILGAQDPATNKGDVLELFSTLVIPPIDAIILQKVVV